VQIIYRIVLYRIVSYYMPVDSTKLGFQFSSFLLLSTTFTVL